MNKMDPNFGGVDRYDYSASDREAAWAGILDSRLSDLRRDSSRLEHLIDVAQLVRPLKGNRFLMVNEIIVRLRATADALERYVKE